MQPNDLPLVCLPTNLSDEAAAELLAFLQELAAAFERHYFGEIARRRRATYERHPCADDPF